MHFRTVASQLAGSAEQLAQAAALGEAPACAQEMATPGELRLPDVTSAVAAKVHRQGLRDSLRPLEAAIRKMERRVACGESVSADEVARLTRGLISVDIRHDKLTPFIVFDVDNTDEDWVHHITATLRAMEQSVAERVGKIVAETVQRAGVEALTPLELRQRLTMRLGEDLKLLPDDVMLFARDPGAIQTFVHQLFVTHFAALTIPDVVFHDLLQQFLHPTDVYVEALAAGIASGEAALRPYDDLLVTYDVLTSLRDGKLRPRYKVAKLGDGLRPGVVRRLEHIGALEYFDPHMILTYSDTGVRKPNPAGMLDLMRRAGVSDPSQVTMIGDGLSTDMRLDEQPSLKGLKEIYTAYGEPDPNDMRDYREYRRIPADDDHEPVPPQRTVQTFPEILHLGDKEWLGVWSQWRAVRAKIPAAQ
ncbi:MAG: HAD family hydrolase [Myxococcota bacterium]